MYPPKRIGQYSVREKIASGGCADIFAAEQDILHRQVVLKILSPERADDANAVQSFRREARIASSIDHPNVIKIHEYARDGDIHFISMEKIDGCSLKDLLSKHTTLNVAAAMEILHQVVLGLASVWRQGSVHCDLKPGNILISATGLVRVIDFGLARPTGEKSEGDLIAGTAMYMSPEHAVGGSLDFNSDIYSLGITLYQMLSGSPPFAGSDKKVLNSHVRDTLPEFETHECIQKLLADMLTKSPQRFGSIDQFVDEVSAAHAECQASSAALLEQFEAEPLPPEPANTPETRAQRVTKPKKRVGRLLAYIFVLFTCWFVPVRFLSVHYHNQAIEMTQRGKPWQAMELYKKAVNCNPFDSTIKKSAVSLLMELTVVRSENLERSLRSIELLKWAIKMRIDEPIIHLQLAWAHQALGNRNEALDAVRQYMKLRPGDQTGQALLNNLEF